ncbi:MAG: bifunctional oligoribonuclease/PAP phosphatase NrnA [Gemmatimonadaceae bacterium]
MTQIDRNYLAVPAHRAAAIQALDPYLVAGKRVALSTHINADGDGCGSEAALARLLAQRGMDVRIVNPTPWPELFQFLLGDDVKDYSDRGAAGFKDIDLLIVLDISEVSRLGNLADAVRALTVPKLVIDHHIASNEPPGEYILTDTKACATGELIYDVASGLGLEITPQIARAIYTAILTDTGSFRFSNTSPRCHAIAGDMLASGADPEELYVRIYASAPAGRVRLLAEVLQTLGVDELHGLAWLSMSSGALQKYGVRQEDLDGIVEQARSIQGTRMAIFFRDLGHGRVKASFRSTGAVDVNAFARQFGGGGHAKAAGAMIAGPLVETRDRVLDLARQFLSTPQPSLSTPHSTEQ